MTNVLLVLAFVALASQVAVAATCTKGKSERKVEVVKKEKSCAVEVGGKEIYKAKVDMKYCDEKYLVHMSRLKSLGYECK